MKPFELEALANAYVSMETDDKGDRKPVISEAETTLSHFHALQFDQLVGKLIEAKALKEKPKVTKISAKGALLVKAKDLINVVGLAARSGVELDEPVPG